MEDFITPSTLPTRHSYFFMLLWFLSLGASAGFRWLDDPAYKERIDQWHQERVAALKKESGWLNLAGLFWLKEGTNTIGGDGNDIVFPTDGPLSRLGSFRLENGSVVFIPAPDADVRVDGQPLTEPLTVFTPDKASPRVLQHGSLRWFIIKRGPKYGIRLRDLDSPLLKTFRGIERYPVDDRWRIQARLEAPSQPRTIPITDVLGLVSQQPLAGTLVFSLRGKTVRLDAVEEGEKLFVLFADPTNEHATYGAGRFLYADKPGPDGTTFIDFNQAINPPCAFTAYATCPLPPKQNRLGVSVTAGEKRFGDH